MSNISDDCKTGLTPLNSLFNSYDEEIIFGGNGTKYINDMLLQAKGYAQDSCDSETYDWMYPLTDQLDTMISKQLYNNFTANFYNLYQSVYRVKSVCKIPLED